jgi:hypothetical protein
MIHMQESMLAEEQKRREAAEQAKKLAETEKSKHEVRDAFTCLKFIYLSSSIWFLCPLQSNDTNALHRRDHTL